MAITRYRNQDLFPGQIVCPGSGQIAGICGHPREVVKATGLTVILRDLRTDAESRKRRSNIAFVCDTAEEGWKLHEASVRFVAQEHEIAERHKQELDARRQEIIAEYVGGRVA